MEVTAVLCNHAESQNNMLYVSGGGVDRALIPPNIPGPWGINVAVGVLIEVPWTQTNQQHTVEIGVIDADDQPVMVPTGPDTTEAVRAHLDFNLGRPPQLEVGEEQTVALAVNFPGLPISRFGRYFFVVTVDGTEVRRLRYTVTGAVGTATYVVP